ncbi:MAG: Uma2 family endonuclease, partial [Spirochaetaceae bacterium]|nr:Uma2 family endonuclease [Spirochaetaceae bacterium]
MAYPVRAPEERFANGDYRRWPDDKHCEAYIAPFDVLLPDGEEADDDVDSVVQPDIVVFCDRSKLTEADARGAPDLVVEILSPSTSKKDQHEKLSLYEKHGVREYWVVDPGNRSIRVLSLSAERCF